VGAAAGSQVAQIQKTVVMNELVVQKQDGNTVIITVQDNGFVKGQRVLVTQQGIRFRYRQLFKISANLH
jgi:outer membrane lipoprotein SlyB